MPSEVINLNVIENNDSSQQKNMIDLKTNENFTTYYDIKHINDEMESESEDVENLEKWAPSYEEISMDISDTETVVIAEYDSIIDVETYQFRNEDVKTELPTSPIKQIFCEDLNIVTDSTFLSNNEITNNVQKIKALCASDNLVTDQNMCSVEHIVRDQIAQFNSGHLDGTLMTENDKRDLNELAISEDANATEPCTIEEENERDNITTCAVPSAFFENNNERGDKKINCKDNTAKPNIKSSKITSLSDEDLNECVEKLKKVKNDDKLSGNESINAVPNNIAKTVCNRNNISVIKGIDAIQSSNIGNGKEINCNKLTTKHSSKTTSKKKIQYSDSLKSSSDQKLKRRRTSDNFISEEININKNDNCCKKSSRSSKEDRRHPASKGKLVKVDNRSTHEKLETKESFGKEDKENISKSNSTRREHSSSKFINEQNVQTIRKRRSNANESHDNEKLGTNFLNNKNIPLKSASEKKSHKHSNKCENTSGDQKSIESEWLEKELLLKDDSYVSSVGSGSLNKERRTSNFISENKLQKVKDGVHAKPNSMSKDRGLLELKSELKVQVAKQNSATSAKNKPEEKQSHGINNCQKKPKSTKDRGKIAVTGKDDKVNKLIKDSASLAKAEKDITKHNSTYNKPQEREIELSRITTENLNSENVHSVKKDNEKDKSIKYSSSNKDHWSKRLEPTGPVDVFTQKLTKYGKVENAPSNDGELLDTNNATDINCKPKKIIQNRRKSCCDIPSEDFQRLPPLTRSKSIDFKNYLSSALRVTRSNSQVFGLVEPLAGPTRRKRAKSTPISTGYSPRSDEEDPCISDNIKLTKVIDSRDPRKRQSVPIQKSREEMMKWSDLLKERKNINYVETICPKKRKLVDHESVPPKKKITVPRNENIKHMPNIIGKNVVIDQNKNVNKRDTNKTLAVDSNKNIDSVANIKTNEKIDKGNISSILEPDNFNERIQSNGTDKLIATGNETNSTEYKETKNNKNKKKLNNSSINITKANNISKTDKISLESILQTSNMDTLKERGSLKPQSISVISDIQIQEAVNKAIEDAISKEINNNEYLPKRNIPLINRTVQSTNELPNKGSLFSKDINNSMGNQFKNVQKHSEVNKVEVRNNIILNETIHGQSGNNVPKQFLPENYSQPAMKVARTVGNCTSQSQEHAASVKYKLNRTTNETKSTCPVANPLQQKPTKTPINEVIKHPYNKFVEDIRNYVLRYMFINDIWKRTKDVNADEINDKEVAYLKMCMKNMFVNLQNEICRYFPSLTIDCFQFDKFIIDLKDAIDAKGPKPSALSLLTYLNNLMSVPYSPYAGAFFQQFNSIIQKLYKYHLDKESMKKNVTTMQTSKLHNSVPSAVQSNTNSSLASTNITYNSNPAAYKDSSLAPTNITYNSNPAAYKDSSLAPTNITYNSNPPAYKDSSIASKNITYNSNPSAYKDTRVSVIKPTDPSKNKNPIRNEAARRLSVTTTSPVYGNPATYIDSRVPSLPRSTDIIRIEEPRVLPAATTTHYNRNPATNVETTISLIDLSNASQNRNQMRNEDPKIVSTATTSYNSKSPPYTGSRNLPSKNYSINPPSCTGPRVMSTNNYNNNQPIYAGMGIEQCLHPVRMTRAQFMQFTHQLRILEEFTKYLALNSSLPLPLCMKNCTQIGDGPVNEVIPRNERIMPSRTNISSDSSQINHHVQNKFACYESQYIDYIQNKRQLPSKETVQNLKKSNHSAKLMPNTRATNVVAPSVDFKQNSIKFNNLKHKRMNNSNVTQNTAHHSRDKLFENKINQPQNNIKQIQNSTLQQSVNTYKHVETCTNKTSKPNSTDFQPLFPNMQRASDFQKNVVVVSSNTVMTSSNVVMQNSSQKVSTAKQKINNNSNIQSSTQTSVKPVASKTTQEIQSTSRQQVIDRNVNFESNSVPLESVINNSIDDLDNKNMLEIGTNKIMIGDEFSSREFIDLENYFEQKNVYVDDDIEIFWPESFVPVPIITDSEIKEQMKTEEPEKFDDPIPRTVSVDSGIASPTQVTEYPATLFENRYCLCGKMATYVCTCKAVIYCSTQCQLTDWENHNVHHYIHLRGNV